jgi:hypothetical protein
MPHTSVKILVRNNVDFPILGREGNVHIICLPEPRKINSSSLFFEGMIFDLNNEIDKKLLLSLFRSSVYHLSAHVAVSNFDLYREWAKKKNVHVATFVASLLEDVEATCYLQKYWSAAASEFPLADVAVYARLKPQSLIYGKMQKIMTAVLSLYHVGVVKGNMLEGMMSDVKDIVALLNELGEYILSNDGFVDEQSSGGVKINPDGEGSLVTLKLNKKLDFANKIYEKIVKYKGISVVPAWPYTESHGRNNIFQNVPINKTKLEDLMKEFLRDEHREACRQLLEVLGKEESFQMLHEWQSREDKKNKILQNYYVFKGDTLFESFEFPQEDYTEYLRARILLGGPIRRVLEKLRLLKNITGEDFRQETGFIDLQEAIQVIASQSRRTDIFVREELQTREDAWAILVDASHSLKYFTGDVLSVAICLAEVAKNLILNQNAWSMYAFNTKFYIIKDFNEPFTNRIKARIGGMKYSGLTYISDGIKVASQVLLRRRNEESKVLVVVSDFFPSGVANAEDELLATVRKIERSGIGIIGIGIRSSTVKKYFRMCCTVRDPYELMKKFSKVFIEYSGMS